jgi:transposase-like protein
VAPPLGGLPALAIIDGSTGLAAALHGPWSALAIQRCTTHKLRSLEAKAPVRLREELAEDYRRMICADSRALVDQAHARLVRNWRLRCPTVVECLEEAGDHLYSVLSFPKAQWKALRTTNALERINGAVRHVRVTRKTGQNRGRHDVGDGQQAYRPEHEPDHDARTERSARHQPRTR